MNEIDRLIAGLKPGGVDIQGWLILADALEEAGRQEEADLIRSDRNCKPVGNRIVECGWCEVCQDERCREDHIPGTFVPYNGGADVDS